MPKLDNGPSYRLALNIFDIDRVEPFIRESLELAKKVDTSAVIRLDESRPDEVGVAFKDDGVNLLTAASICDILRGHDKKAGDYPTRVYIKKEDASWTRLPGEVTLTLVSRGSIILNPKVFPSTLELAKVEPLPIQVQEF